MSMTYDGGISFRKSANSLLSQVLTFIPAACFAFWKELLRLMRFANIPMVQNRKHDNNLLSVAPN